MLLVGEQVTHGWPLHREFRGVAGVLGQHADHLQRNDRATPRARPWRPEYQGEVSVILASFWVSEERVERAHVLPGRRPSAPARPRLPFKANMQILEDQQLLRGAQGGHPLLQHSVGPKSGPKAGAGFQHLRSVGLLRPDLGRCRTWGRDLGEGANLLTLDHHVQVVGRQAAALEPGLTPDLRQQRREHGKVRRPLDRPRAEAELLSHGVIVDRRVAAVFLVSQHLLGQPGAGR